jgi:hypothetical protein
MNAHRYTKLVSLVCIFFGIAITGRAQELKPAWRPKSILAEYRAFPGTFCFVAEVDVPEWNQKVKMLVDTGCSMTVFDDSFKSKLRLTKKTVKVNGLQNRLSTFHAPPIRSQEFQSQPKDGVICMDLGEFGDALEMQLDGLLGMDCFTDAILHYDFDRENLIVAAHHEGDIPPGNPLSVRVRNNVVYMPLSVGQKTELEFLVDSGLFDVMKMKQASFDHFIREGTIVKNEHPRESLGITTGQIIRDSGQCSRLQLLDTTHHDLMVVAGNQNMIGNLFLNRYRVTIDAANQRLYLDPGRRHLHRDCSGMDGVTLVGKTNDEKVVAEVVAKRLAYQCGLKKGDVIVQIGDRSVRKLSSYQTDCLWMDQRATALNLRIRRGEELFDVIIRGDERPSVLDPESAELTPIKR